MPSTKDTGRGNTIPQQGERQERSPRMPHERDESVQSQEADEPSATQVGEIARRDVERGVRDTTKQAELEETYDKLAKRG